MRKSLLITLDFPPDKGGTANYLGNIYSRLPADRILILTHSLGNGVRKRVPKRLGAELGSEFPNAAAFPNVIRERLFWRSWPRWAPLVWQTAKIIQKEKVEYLHISHILPVGYVTLIFKKIWGLPYLVYVHGLDIVKPQKSVWKKFWLKMILRNADLIVANSEYTKKQALSLTAPKLTPLIIVVYPAPVLLSLESAWKPSSRLETRFPSGIKKKNPEKIILSVGRLIERKGFDMVIRAMPQILKLVPKARYLVVGDGPYQKQLSLIAKQLSLDQKVIFLGAQSNEQLTAYYQLCDVFAMPCREVRGDVEGFGMVFLEAAMFGKPSVAGASGGAPEAVKHNVTGLVVNPQSVDEVAGAITKLLRDETLAKKLGEQGRARVLEGFGWEKQIKKIEVGLL